MPEYYPREIQGYKVDISPSGRWRRLLKVFRIESHYFVGEEISLTLTFIKINPYSDGLPSHSAITSYQPQMKYEHPSQTIHPLPKMGELPVKINYKTSASGEGIVYVCFHSMDSITVTENNRTMTTNEIELFSTGVIHRDFFKRDIYLVVLGIVGGGIFGCIAGIIASL